MAQIRSIRSPVTQAMLAPLEPDCQSLQFAAPLTDDEYRRVSQVLEARPEVKLRAYGEIASLDFLEYFPTLRHFQVDEAPGLEDLSGLRHLSAEIDSLAIGARLSRPFSVKPLTRLSHLRRLWVEGPLRDLGVIAELEDLRHLTLRSVTLPNLKFLQPLEQLSSLVMKLGGTRNLTDLSSIGRLRYIELAMVRGLADLAPIASVTTLQYLVLQALPRVARIPPLHRLTNLTGACLERMNGVRDPCPLAHAPVLEELVFIAMQALQPASLTCFVGHPSLKYATIGLGSGRKNREAARILSLPEPPPAFGLRWEASAARG